MLADKTVRETAKTSKMTKTTKTRAVSEEKTYEKASKYQKSFRKTKRNRKKNDSPKIKKTYYNPFKMEPGGSNWSQNVFKIEPKSEKTR